MLGGTVATYDDLRGIHAGRMFIVALNPGGTADIRFMPTSTTVGVVVVPADGWHEEALGITFYEEDGGESRITIAGMSFADGSGPTTRRVRVASYLVTGGVFAAPATPTIRASALVDAWATDVISRDAGEPVLSVAHRSGVFVDPIPPPNPPPGP